MRFAEDSILPVFFGFESGLPNCEEEKRAGNSAHHAPLVQILARFNRGNAAESGPFALNQRKVL